MADVRPLNISDLTDVPAEQIPAVIAQLAAAQSMLAARLLSERLVVQGNSTEAGKLLTAGEAAGRAGMSRVWFYRHARNLPFAVRVGRSLRFSEAGLERWVRSRSGRG